MSTFRRETSEHFYYIQVHNVSSVTLQIVQIGADDILVVDPGGSPVSAMPSRWNNNILPHLVQLCSFGKWVCPPIPTLFEQETNKKAMHYCNLVHQHDL